MKKINTGFWLLILPLLLWLLLFLVAPYFAVLKQSFATTDEFGKVKGGFSLDAYQRFFTTALYPSTLGQSFMLAFKVTFFGMLLSIPLCYYIAFKAKPSRKTLLSTLIILPLWVSYIVRAYAWKIILGEQGILNTFLIKTGIVHQPVEWLLYSEISIIICMVHIYSPFIMMPVYTAFEQIPRSLVEASKDLGANRLTTFIKIVLPLSLPGILVGCTFAFVLSLGDFLAPVLLGGPNNLYIANIFQNLFGTSNDKPLGSAVGIILLIIVTIVLELSARGEKKYATLEPK